MKGQVDMIDSMYDKENKELLVAKNVKISYRNLACISDIIYSTSLRFNNSGAISINRKLAYAVENIHYSIFHMCEFFYRETRELKEYKNDTPISLLDTVEKRIDAGNVPGRPLDALIQLWEEASQSCRNAIRIASKTLKDDRSIVAAGYFNKSAREVRTALRDAYLISQKKYYNAL